MLTRPQLESGKRLRRRGLRVLVSALAAILVGLQGAKLQAQFLGSNCTATMLNHSVQLNADGTFNIPNIPFNYGLYRVHVLCVNSDGTTSGGASDFVNLTPDGSQDISLIDVGPPQPFPVTMSVNADTLLLGAAGATTQLHTVGTLPNGDFEDETASPGTTYFSSNTAIATVTTAGLVSAAGAGLAMITVRYDGLVATVPINVSAKIDSDGDGMPDEWEIANGLNPFDPSDAGQDPDGDGLTNLQEYKLGTNPHVADTDGDGLSDGQEVKLGTNPLVADTDGDGLSDGQEVQLGTNPLVVDTDGDGIPDGIEVKLGLNPLVADPTTLVTGHVVGPDGKPVAGASATLFGYFTGTTDTTGTFTVPTVPTDLTALVAQVLYVAPGGAVYNGASQPVAGVAAGTTDLGVVQLGVSSGVVQGVITSPSGKPVAGAQVTVSGGQVQLATSTDATGTYRVTNLPAGSVVVSALDPQTGLRGTASGGLNGTTPLTVNIMLGGFGSVTGSVTEPDGRQAPSGVSVQLTGPTTLTTATNALGQYSFAFVPLGTFVVQASDSSGHQGSATGLVVATSETVTANIQFSGSGTVSGLIQDKQGKPAAAAQVSLLSATNGQQQMNTQSDANGNYSFANVVVGKFTVSAAIPQSRQGYNELGGTAQGAIQQNGQAVTVNVTVDAAGSLAGTVYKSDGKTPAQGVKVAVKSFATSATTGANGGYELDFVPPGQQTISVADPATGDQGAGAVTVTAGQLAQVPNISLNGLGTAVVTVQDASGNLVASAQVTLISDTQFVQQLTGLTNSAGQYTFSGALAGAVTVNANGSSTLAKLAGKAQGTVPLNGSVQITVALQPAGTISGTVFAADGQTPAPAVTVQLDSAETTISDGSGMYQFLAVPSGDHVLQAIDGKGEPDSPIQKATITSQGQTVTANVTLIGLGTVSGSVTNADGSAAVGVAINLKSEDPGYVRLLAAQTDTGGNYSIAQVPVGSVVVTASGAGGIASGTGTLSGDGAALTVNLVLNPNVVNAAHSFFDANGFLYDIDPSGEIQSGTNSVFAGLGIPFPGRFDESLNFKLIDGSTVYFVGAATATSGLSGYESSIEQDGIGGLNVVRRVYVPPTGYMARYIETLVNPTASAITVDVNLHSGYRYTHETRNGYSYNGTPGVVSTSSGDASFNVTTDPTTSDHWIVEGTDLDVDPFLDTNNVPPVAYVFDDGQSPIALTGGSFETTSNHGEMAATWGKVNVPAGQTVELMHFVSEQPLRASAVAAAQRLIQLPPEALGGLTAADAATVANFRVPMNLTSTLQSLPTLTGTVTGQVIASDNTTPVAGAVVSYQSSDPLYARTYQVLSGPDGSFLYQSNPDGAADAVAIPVEAGNLSATNPESQLVSPTYTVPLSPTNPFLSQSIVFSNTGQISGTVRLTPTQVVSAGTVTVSSPSLLSAPAVAINVDGTYLVTGLPAATYAVTATVAGTILTGSTTATVVDGQTVTADILVGANGTVQGEVLGADAQHSPLAGITVYLRNAAGQSVSTLSGTGGNFVFNELPPGAYSLQAYDPASNTGATVAVTVTAGATVTQNITLSGGASVTGTITGPSGVSVDGLTVTLTVNTGSSTQSYTTASNSAGSFTFKNVVLGSFAVAVQGTGGYSGFAGGNLAVAGQTATVAVVLAQSGTIKGAVFQSDGKTPAAGIQVQIYGQTSPYRQTLVATLTTDASGNYTSSQVPLGGFTVVARNTATGDEGVATGTIVTVNQIVTVNLNLAGLGTLKISVLNSSSQADPGIAITVSGPFNSSYTATTDQNGAATISNVLAGTLQVSATDSTTRLAASKQVTLTPGATLSVTLQLQASGVLSGHVYAPNGSTAAGGAKLVLYGTGGILYTNYAATSQDDGSYQFSGVTLGIYNLAVYDSNSILRAYVPGLSITTNGQVLTENVTFTGIGTVQGTVTNPDGTAAGSIAVQVVSNSKLGGVFNVSTDVSGNYKALGVPIGAFTVNAENLAQGVGGSATGTIASDGDTEVVNIQMASNVVQLTQTLTDFNGFKYDVQKDGTIGNGSEYYFGIGNFWCTCGNDDYNNAFHLALFLGGTEDDFTGNSTATGITSVGGQEISIEQDGLAGLNVTRHVYVPKTGYFARYVETLTNPTSAPITVDLEVSGGVQSPGAGATLLVSTSSGDAALSKADEWVITDDDNGSNPWPLSQPALGEVFAGPGAKQAPDVATLTLPNAQNKVYYPQLVYRWNSITVAPGGSYEIMHFAVQQALQGQTTAAVQRLVQQPPEIFPGLAASDASAIANFALSSSLSSTLPALVPPAAGSVSGHVYGADDASAVATPEVFFQGSDLFFGTGAAVGGDASGAFTFTGVPIGNFTVNSVEPLLHFMSPSDSGKFAAGATTATQDVIFSNAAVVKGTIDVPSETTFVSATASLLENSGLTTVWTTNIGGSSNFTLPVVPPGSYASPADSYSILVQAAAPGSNYINFGVAQPIDPKAGDVVNLTFTLPDTGSLSGAFTNAAGAAIANVTVFIGQNGTGSAIGNALTDANGKFQFAELAVGTYTLSATDPASGLIASANVTITKGVAAVQNLQIANGGTVNLTVTLNGGGVAANSLVTITRSTDNGVYVTAGVTDATGKLAIVNVPVGNFTVIVYYPGVAISLGSVQASAKGAIASNGQALALAVALPATSTITGTVSSYSGTPVANASVSFYYQGSINYDGYQTTTTNSSGVYTFSPVFTSQAILLIANTPSNAFTTRLTVTTAASGTLTQNITLPVSATLVVKVLDANAAPLPNEYVTLQLTGNSTTGNDNYYSSGGSTQGDGTATFTGVADGNYGILLYNSSFIFAGSGKTVIATTDDGKTVNATAQVGYTGTIKGTVVGADGVTPAPPGNYTIYLIDTDNYNSTNFSVGEIASLQSTDGTYSFPNLASGRDGYTIIVYPPYFPNSSVALANGVSTGKLTANGQTVITNTTIAVPVVSGTVYEADGTTPAASPNVYASVSAGIFAGTPPVVYQGISSANGTYAVAVPAPAAETSIVAEAGGLTSQAQVNVNTGDVTDTLNVTLHASGTVSGTVTDQSSNPLYGTTLSVQSSGSSYKLFAPVNYYNSDGSLNSTGAFTLPYVATGDITVTDTYTPYAGYNCTATSTGKLVNNGDTLTVKVTVNTNSCTTDGSVVGGAASAALIRAFGQRNTNLNSGLDLLAFHVIKAPGVSFRFSTVPARPRWGVLAGSAYAKASLRGGQ